MPTAYIYIYTCILCYTCVCVCVFILDNRRRVIRADGAPAATHMQLHIAHIIIIITYDMRYGAQIHMPRYNIILCTITARWNYILYTSIIPV